MSNIFIACFFKGAKVAKMGTEFSQDPPYDLLSEQSLALIPRWARVAFAARCAERVLPIYEKGDLNAIVPLDNIIAKIVESARTAKPGGPHLASTPAMAAENARKKGAEIEARVADAVRAAGFTAARGTAQAAFACYLNATEAAKHAFGKDAVKFQNAAVDDIEILKRESSFKKWTDSSPVDVDLLGQLWPEGAPEVQSVEKNLRPSSNIPTEALELYFEPGAASPEAITRLLSAISKLHIASGGAGLEFVSDEDFLYIKEMAYA